MKAILRVLLIAGAVLAVTLMSLWQVRQMSQAQDPPPDIAITKTLNRAGNVVRVGDVLEFTIVVTNQSAFTLTNVTLVDTFDETILAFQEATPVVTAASNTVTWGNVATMLNPVGMLPGDTVVVTISFRAMRPRTAIVNRVEGRDIIREGSQSGTGSNNETNNEGVIPANAPVYKSISPPGSLPQAGLPVTFTQLITNDSGAFLIYLPLTDTYEAAFLQFNYALPMPDVITPPGTLVWTNLASLAYFGPITPDTTLAITTVFTATTQVVNTTNRASTQGALDEFDNEAAGGVAEVPITIIEDTPTPTVTPAPTRGANNNDNNDDDDDNNDDNDTSPATPVAPAPVTATPAPVIATPTPTATSTATPTTGPIYLPETGSRNFADPLGVIAGLALLALAGLAVKKLKYKT